MIKCLRHGRILRPVIPELEVLVKRRLLAYVTGGLLAVGIIAVGIVMASSLRLNDGAKARRLTIDISSLVLGSFKIVERGSERLFVLRSGTDTVSVIAVPLWAGDSYLPIPDRRHFEGPCHRFEPENRAGILVNGGEFRCADADATEGYFYSLRWSSSGRRIGDRTSEDEDLWILKIERSGNIVTIPRPQ